MRRSGGNPDFRVRARHLGPFPRIDSGPWRIVGQDGGQSIDLGEQTLFVFSDTLLAPLEPPRTRSLQRPPFMLGVDDPVSFLGNCGALSQAADMRQALATKRFFAEADGLPRTLLEPTLDEAAAGLRFWPAHGIALDGGVFLYYLGIQQAAPRSVWDFRNLGVGLALLDPVTGRCERVRRGGDWRLWSLPVDDFHFGVQVLRQADELFVFGSVRDGLRTHGTLGRVGVHDLADPSAYRYYDAGSGRWTEDPAAVAVDQCGADYSVSYNTYLGRYLMTYVDSFTKVLWLRTAERVEGPYAAPTSAGRVPHDPASELVYLAFEHPKFAVDGGSRTYVSYCQPRFMPNALLEVRFP
jgi:hypothetical protein